jgi:hypothetical protein
VPVNKQSTGQKTNLPTKQTNQSTTLLDANLPINQLFRRPTKQPMYQLIKRTNQPTNKSTSQKPTIQPKNQPAYQNTNHPTSQPNYQPTNQNTYSHEPDNQLNQSTEQTLNKGGVLRQEQIDISQSIPAYKTHCWLITRLSYKYNSDCACANGFPVLTEGLNMIKQRNFGGYLY